MTPRTAQMVAAAESVEWIQVRNDVEALMLEYSLIKQHRPRFNIRLRDDKSYPFLAITTGDDWPRAMVMRGKKRKGVTYFGPYGHAYAIRETLDLLLRTFPIRTCSDNKFGHHARLGRPCLLFHIEKCTGPCVGEVGRSEYDGLVDELIQFLCGETQDVVRRLERQMAEAADQLEFERAARYRDRLTAVRKAIEKQAVVTDRPEDLDVIGIHGDDLEAAVQVFYVRKGRVMGRKGFVVDKVEDVTPEQLMGHVLEGLYYDADPTARARALNSLQEALGLPDPPLRIECYDMSHIQGSDYVGSMVVMEDGLAKKSEYRRFKIREVPGNADFAAMEEVLTRRLTALLIERDRPVGDRPRKFNYPPNLLVVDGGKGQLSVAVKVVEELGLEDEIAVASLAKRFEEVYVPGQADPIRIPRQSEALYLLQRLRDEAHRFAISYHRELRGKRMTKSSIDDIPGLGPARKKQRVKELGGIGAVQAAALPWLPDAVAIAVYERFQASV